MNAIDLSKWHGLALALTAATAATATPTMPQAGPLGTLPIGYYQCALPGDATGPAWVRTSNRDFSIVNASSYEMGGERGVYLLRGEQVSFTSGPMRGMSFERTGSRTLRERQANGQLGRTRCVRAGPAD